MKMLVDSSRCTGCKSCELVCSGSHTGEFNPGRSRIQVKNDSFNGQSVINVCRQCPDHPCVTACAFEACVLNEETGFIEIREDNCSGCNKCVEECPYQAMFADEVGSVAFVCDGCKGDLLCVKFCYKAALTRE